MSSSLIACRTSNILTFMGLIKEPGRVIIITNYVTGMNLFELVHSDKKVHYVCGHDHSALVLFIVIPG